MLSKPRQTIALLKKSCFYGTAKIFYLACIRYLVSACVSNCYAIAHQRKQVTCLVAKAIALLPA